VLTNSRSTFSPLAQAVIAVFLGVAAMAPATGGLLGDQQKPTPTNPDTLFQSGVTYLKEKKYREAEEAFRKVSELEPANLRGDLGLAEVYMTQNRPDDAIQFLQASAKKNPTRLDYHASIGNLAMRAAKYELAIQEYLFVLNRIDKYSQAAGDLYLRIGDAYRRKGDLDFAVIFLRQAKELLPQNVPVLGTLALALEASGRKEEAAREYTSALDSDPNNPGALNNLALLLSESGGDLDAALQCAQRARELQPDSPDIADTLGWVYVKKNMTDQAITILREAVKGIPGRSSPHYHLAMALNQKGDRSGAIAELNSALQNNPPKDEEQQIIGLLQKIGKPD